MKPSQWQCPDSVAMELHAINFLAGVPPEAAAVLLVEKKLAPNASTALLWIGWFACKEALQAEAAAAFEREQREQMQPIFGVPPKLDRVWPALDFWSEAYLAALRGLLDPVLHGQSGNVNQRAAEIAQQAVADYFNAEQRGIAAAGELVKFANDPSQKGPR